MNVISPCFVHEHIMFLFDLEFNHKPIFNPNAKKFDVSSEGPSSALLGSLAT
jgi:hypothetical protein